MQNKTIKSNKVETDAVPGELNPHAVVECIRILCSAATLTTEDVQQMCLDAFLVAHHPLVLSVINNLWIKIVKYLKINSKHLVIQQRDYFKQTLIKDYKLSSVSISDYDNYVRYIIRQWSNIFCIWMFIYWVLYVINLLKLKV